MLQCHTIVCKKRQDKWFTDCVPQHYVRGGEYNFYDNILLYMRRVVRPVTCKSFSLVLLRDAVSGCGWGEIGGSFTTLLLADPGLDLVTFEDEYLFTHPFSAALCWSFLKSAGIE